MDLYKADNTLPDRGRSASMISPRLSRLCMRAFGPLRCQRGILCLESLRVSHIMGACVLFA